MNDAQAPEELSRRLGLCTLTHTKHGGPPGQDDSKDVTHIAFQLLDKGGKRTRAYAQSELVGRTPLVAAPQNNKEFTLDPSTRRTPYTLVVCTNNPGVECAFSLTLYADAPLDGKFCVPGPDAGSGELMLIPDSVPAV